MTTTDIREALHAVGAAATAPPVDQLAFQRRVGAARRRRTGARLAVAGVAAAAVAAVAVSVPQLGDGAGTVVEPATPPSSGVEGGTTWQLPVAFVADGRLRAVDPSGTRHEFDGRVEELLGVTAEDIWVVDADSHLGRWHAQRTAQGGWEYDASDDVPWDGPVQSARLSGDGRWLGWVDLDEKVHVVDLEDGSAEVYDRDGMTGTRYLADVASGTGAPLVADDSGLVLYSDAGYVEVPVAGGGGWASSAAGYQVAVVNGDGTTHVFDTRTGVAVAERELPGTARYSPTGDYLATVAVARDDSAVFSTWSPAGGLQDVELPGIPQAAGWADDDTALVTTAIDGSTAVYACEVADSACLVLLPAGEEVGAVTLGG